MRQRRNAAADARQPGRAQRRGRIVRHGRFIQPFARQIEPPAFGVLLQIAQDVGELQRAAERVGHTVGVRRGVAEGPHGEPSHGGGDPVAIQIERGEIRRDDHGFGVHLHAVDDRQEILPAKVETPHRGDQDTR